MLLLFAVPLQGQAPHIHRLLFAGVEEQVERVLVVACEVPEASPVVTRTSRHEAEHDLLPLLLRDTRMHDTVNHFRERTVATEHEQLVVTFLHELTRQLGSMRGILGHFICEGLMAFFDQFEQIQPLFTIAVLTRFGIDNDT